MSQRILRGAPAGVAVVTLVAAWFAGRGANRGPIGFRLDDAWIHMVYGRGLLANGFLAYEDGVASTGCTSPLWAVVLAGLHALFGRAGSADAVVAAVILAGAVFHVAGALAAASLTRRVTGDDRVAALGGGLVAIAPPLAAASLSGMEVAMTAWLLLRGALAVAEGKPARGGIWLAAAGLARPESAAVLAVALAFALLPAPPGRRAATAARLLGPPLLAGVAFLAYDLWASGAPLPATFYAKSSASLLDLPRRLGVALTAIVPAVSPFVAGIGWLAAAGVFAARTGATSRATRSPASAASPSDAGPAAGTRPPANDSAARFLPLAAGLAYLFANVTVLDPRDPAAFYHQRYVFPALPLLLAAAATGAAAWGRRASGPRALLPATLVAAVALAQAAWTVAPVSRQFHNDVRNINEVQRRIGERLGRELPPGTRIAASDAGAIRYFSRLPTLDVIGMNTPGMRAPTEEYVRAHPVAALAFLPAWFRTPDGAVLEEWFRAETTDYTVTSYPPMALQLVVRARPDAGRVRARFGGFRPFALDFVSPGDAR